MKTKLPHIFSITLALLVANFAGCDSPGPITRAITLSGLKTFDVVQKNPMGSPPGADTDVLAQTAREEAQSKGYQWQSASPDFIIYVGWASADKMVQATQPGPPDVAVTMVMLSITAKDAATNDVLWTAPGGLGPVAAKGLVAEDAKVMVRKAMKDFPPQTSR